MIYQATTHDIEVSVKVFHDDELRTVEGDGFVYRYFIDITNRSTSPAKLLSRHWYICDILHGMKEVVGDGVVGRQPIIKSGMTYRYHSAAALQSKLGYMYGTYTMLDINKNVTFEIVIPRFQLISPERYN